MADVFDSDRVHALLATAEPEVVVHQLTALPKRLDCARLDEAYAGTERLRTEGTRILVAAARAAGARRMVAQSIAFLYAPEGGAVKDEDARAFTDAPEPFGGDGSGADGPRAPGHRGGRHRGVVLRYGWFYGPGTYIAADGASADEVRRRRQPVVGKGGGVLSFIHVDDAAGGDGGRGGGRAARDLQRGGRRAGARRASGCPPSPRPSARRGRGECRAGSPSSFAPKMLVEMATTLRGASNARFKAAFGWQPGYPSWRQGFPEELR